MANLTSTKWADVIPPTGSYHLIKNWFDQQAMIILYGATNLGKTNVALSQALAIAQGVPWGGHETRQGLVVYVTLEGSRGFQARVTAYKKKYNIGTLPFVLVQGQLDMRQRGDATELLRLIGVAEGDFKQKCVLIVIDTLSRALPGGEESGSKDMTTFVFNCDTIKINTRASVYVVHHTGKHQAAGARGHSSLRAATDTEIEVAEVRGKRIARVTKQRDIEVRSKMQFDYEKVEIGKDANGNPLTSIVTVVGSGSGVASGLANMSSAQQVMLLTLRDLVFSWVGLVPKDFTNYDPSEVTPAALQVWIGSRAWKTALNIQKGDHAADKAFDRDVAALEAAGAIDVESSPGKEKQHRLKH